MLQYVFDSQHEDLASTVFIEQNDSKRKTTKRLDDKTEKEKMLADEAYSAI
jgi:hypothetical protein